MRLLRLIVLVACAALRSTDVSAQEWEELYEIGLKAAGEFEYELAKTNLQLALDAAREADATPVETGRIMDALAETYFYDSCRDDAVRAYRESLEFKRERLGERHPAVADTLLGLSEVLSGQGERDEAGAMIQSAIEIRRETFGDSHPALSEALVRLGWHYEGIDRLTDAEGVFRDAIEGVEDCRTPVKELFDALLGLKETLRRQGRVAEAQGLQPRIDDVYERLPKDWWSASSVCERGIQR